MSRALNKGERNLCTNQERLLLKGNGEHSGIRDLACTKTNPIFFCCMYNWDSPDIILGINIELLDVVDNCH